MRKHFILRQKWRTIHHFSVGHRGRNRMLSVLKKRYTKIKKETVTANLQFCISCQKESVLPNKGLVSKLISRFRLRKSIMITEQNTYHFENTAKYAYRWSHVQLFWHLFNFCDTCVVSFDNGREFVNKVTDELTSIRMRWRYFWESCC